MVIVAAVLGVACIAALTRRRTRGACRLLDDNGDGTVSPSELHTFLQYFGPLNVSVQRAVDSLLVSSGETLCLHSWFSWNKLDRAAVADLLPRQGRGTYVVRCASVPGHFAVSAVKVSANGDTSRPSRADVEHYLVVNDGLAGYRLEEGWSRTRPARAHHAEHFPDLFKLLTRYSGIFSKSYVDHKQRIVINVGGRRFETMSGAPVRCLV